MRLIKLYFYTGCHSAISASFLLLYICNKSSYSLTYNKILTLFTAVWFGYTWVQLPLLYDKKYLRFKAQINQRLDFFNSYSSQLYGFTFFLVITNLYLIYQLPYFTLLILLFLSSLLFLYQLPYFSLRRVPYIKPFIISFIWASLILIIALLPESYHKLVNKNFLYDFLEIFFFILSLTLLFDYRDSDKDTLQGLKTFANTFDNKNTIKLFSFIAMLLSYLEYVSWPSSNLFTSLPTLMLYLFLLIYIQKKTSDLFYLIVVDSLMILKYLSLYFLGG